VRSSVWGSFILLAAFWGASFLWIKIAVADVGVFPLAAYRLAFAMVGLAPFAMWHRPRPPRDLRSWFAIAVVGLFGTTFPWLFIAWAETSIDSALATVLNSTTPLFTLVLAHFALQDDRMTRTRVAGLCVGFCGVLVLSMRDGLFGGGPLATSLAGPGAMLCAAACYAISSVVARRSLRHMTTLTQVFYAMAIATAFAWLFLPVAGVGVPAPSRNTVWVAIAWLGVLGAGFGAYLYFYVLHAVGPTRASLITYVIPPVGVTLGIVVLGERLDALLVIGSLLIVAALWVVNHKR